MRVSRTWRDLSNQKRVGFGYDAQNDPGKGELAIFVLHVLNQVLTCLRTGLSSMIGQCTFMPPLKI